MVTTFGRLSKGSRIQDAYHVPDPLPPITSIDSAFQLQEYITLLIKADVHDVQRIVNIPTKHADDDGSSNSNTSSSESDRDAHEHEHEEKAADEHCWIYEQLRRVALDLSYPLLTALQLECNRTTCPEMKADEWLYLCVAHGTGQGGVIEQQCCAIDYIVHTLDSATALLNSPKAFPSRISIPTASRRHFHSLARRLSRIFAHAYYHHREAFEQCEAESSLYSRFYYLSRTFDLVPAEFLIPPPPLPSSNKSSSESSTADDDDAAFTRRASSHSLPRPDASALPSPKPSPSLSGTRNESAIDDSNNSGSLNRTDTMFLSSDSLNASLQAIEAKWQHQQHPHGDDHHSSDEDDMDQIDDDGYDIVEGLSSQGLGEMMQGIEDDEEEPEDGEAESEADESNVVVDEMDGAGEGMPPVDSTHTTHTEEEQGEMARAVEEASTLPILHSGLSPGLSPKVDQISTGGFELNSPVQTRSPLRSPRRGTLRQADVSPRHASHALPEFEEVAPISLSGPPPAPAPVSVHDVNVVPVSVQQQDEEEDDDEDAGGDVKHAPDTEQHPPTAPGPEELEEVDLSTGPTIVDEVDKLKTE